MAIHASDVHTFTFLACSLLIARLRFPVLFSYVQFVSGAPNEIALASYCQRSPQQQHVRYTMRACTQALHRAFAMKAIHDLYLC
jgi:hypothetical protein